MKKLLLLFVLFSLAASTFAVYVDINGIYYEVISKAKEAKVCGATDENNIVIPEAVEYEGITYRVTGIKAGAFYNYRNLVSITIPKSVTNVGSNAFNGCSSLKSVYITDIEAWCKIPFDYDYYLDESRDLAYEVHIISNPLYYARHLFLNGEEVKDLVIPSGVTSIGEYTFQGCTFNSVTICITDFSTFIKNKILAQAYFSSVRLADKDGNEINEFIIPDDISAIDDRTFCNCSGLTSVMIPNSVKSIGSRAFSNCI